MAELVSVIIPVYNVAEYLEECLDSVLNQTYEALEILLVDDGSTDLSGKICDEYAKRDKRVHAFHQQNGGAGKAKNTGLKNMKGKLVVFVDSDDVLPLDSIEFRVRKLEENQADIVQAKFQEFSDKLEQKKSLTMTSDEIITKEKYLERFLQNWENALFWNKIFKCKVLHGLQFPVGRCIDDEFFTYKAIFQSEKIVLSDYVIYDYRIRSNSAIHNSAHEEKKLYDQIDFTYLRYLDIREKFPRIKNIYLENLIDNYIQFSRKAIFSKEHKVYMKKLIQQIKKDIAFGRYPVHLKYQFLKSIRG